MTARISVLVPVYNVERYLHQCLGSIQNQTFTDFEVLCINDGSKDGSLDIIKSYADKDERFKIIDKNNSGYGHSMNTGLDKATGSYIAIVESDDYIEENMLERLYSLAIEHDLDIARCNYYKFTETSKEKEYLDYVPQNTVVCPLDAVAVFYQAPAIWVNLYRADLLKKNGIRFLETPGASYQDTSFIFKAYACCQRFLLVDEPLLNYRLDNSNSSVNNQEKVFYVCDEYREILCFAKKNAAIYDKIKYHIPVLRFACYGWNFGRIGKKYKMSFLKRWAEEIRDDYKNGRIDANIISRNRRKKMWFIRYFPIAYKWRKKGL
ncbi:MAG: Glycosyl transferase family 2 protein [Candidatus Tokpelaia hoelldobleri]|uniref:Glycosyl transferase family 2 protein n=1 Tax=Candidatus Tokpelaia hoelldobleri TaxID=1902579 RepID=A0A1U9JWX1_9HYPH|nr:MAG: Glycosyl transferase family 2 protein [Candidatus Tokpelaia hoelldoblerii]